MEGATCHGIQFVGCSLLSLRARVGAMPVSVMHHAILGPEPGRRENHFTSQSGRNDDTDGDLCVPVIYFRYWLTRSPFLVLLFRSEWGHRLSCWGHVWDVLHPHRMLTCSCCGLCVRRSHKARSRADGKVGLSQWLARFFGVAFAAQLKKRGILPPEEGSSEWNGGQSHRRAGSE